MPALTPKESKPDVELCPGCHRADPLLKTECGACLDEPAVAVAVTIPVNVCGRCGIEIAEAARSAVLSKLAAMRSGQRRAERRLL